MKVLVVSLMKKLYTHCLVLFGLSNTLEFDLHKQYKRYIHMHCHCQFTAK